ncbi:MAG: PIN domain-containing protein [Bifidobacteriaceae bacterium]|jgi:predicted nucleic acid-binding protein|nr:PIN domain-containing protein [Bifidobacteriaceae bacterium]
MTRQFVDTNVLVYAYDLGAGERHERARQLVDELAVGRQGAVSVQVLQEFYVTITRKAAVPVASAVARQRVAALNLWPVHAPAGGDVVAAAELAERWQVSFWDAMILQSASQLGCATLWTEDLNDGQTVDGVMIRNPFA